MKTIQIVAGQEIRALLRSKGIMITVVTMLVVVIAAIFGTSWYQKNQDQLPELVVVGVDSAPFAARNNLTVTTAPDRTAAEQQVREGKDAALVATDQGFDLLADGAPSESLVTTVTAAVQRMAQERALAQLHITEQQYSQATPPSAITTVNVGSSKRVHNLPWGVHHDDIHYDVRSHSGQPGDGGKIVPGDRNHPVQCAAAEFSGGEAPGQFDYGSAQHGNHYHGRCDCGAVHRSAQGYDHQLWHDSAAHSGLHPGDAVFRQPVRGGRVDGVAHRGFAVHPVAHPDSHDGNNVCGRVRLPQRIEPNCAGLGVDSPVLYDPDTHLLCG